MGCLPRNSRYCGCDDGQFGRAADAVRRLRLRAVVAAVAGRSRLHGAVVVRRMLAAAAG